MLGNFLSCRDRFRLKYVIGLALPDKWEKTWGYGNMWHAAEEGLAASPHDGQWEYVLTKHTQEQIRRYPLQRTELMWWHQTCVTQFPEYIQHWSNHPDVKNRTPLLQEQVFDVPYELPSGRVVRLRGKWDSVDLIEAGACECGADRTGPSAEAHVQGCPASYATGVYLQENKSKGDVDELRIERQLRFDLQTMLYLVALRLYFQSYTPSDWVTLREKWNIRANVELGGNLRGVRYNVVRRPWSGGKGNISPHQAKSTKSKYVPAETEEHFFERFRRDYLAKEPGYWFFRTRTEVTKWNVEVFKDTFLNPILEQVCWWYDFITGTPPSSATNWEALVRSLNYRTPFGVWSALEHDRGTEYDACLETGSEAGLRRVEELFTELKS